MIVALLAAVASAQNTRPSCSEPEDIHKLSLKEVRGRLDAGADDFFLYKRLEDLTPERPKPGSLETLFEKKLKDHPDDPRYVYLYGRSLIGKRTPDAIVQLRRAVELDPKLAWTYLELAGIYTSYNFGDLTKFAASVNSYRELCPANLDGYNWAHSETDSVKSADWTKKFRVLLESRAEEGNHGYWTDLWAAEFRLASKANYSYLRARVAEDVKRLEAAQQPWPRAVIADLATGYMLTERPDLAARMDLRLDPDLETHKASQAFMKESNWDGQLSAEERESAMRALAKQAAQWVAKWPDSAAAWQTRLTFLSHERNWTKEQMEHAGEELLRTDPLRDFGWTPVPEKLDVARQWVRYGIRVKDAVTLAEEALDETLLGPEVISDLYAQPNSHADINLFNRNLFFAWSAIVDGSLALKDLDKARGAIATMQKWVDDNQSLEDKPSSGFSRWRGMWLNSAGKLAEAEGRKLDAIAFYTKAIGERAQDPDMAKHARALWDEMGGTKEGWDSLTTKKPVPARRPVVSTAYQFAPWKDFEKSLPEMDLRDAAGKTWTLASFQGKTTIIALWATYCSPCRDELPGVQRLYQLIKDRADIQIVTLNLDPDPGLVEPFLAANHYTFPVLMDAERYAGSLATGSLAIPQNWLVDRRMILRQKSEGFDDKIPDWPGAMLQKLTTSLP